jgi:alpha-mannosidase
VHRGPLRGELALRYRLVDAETQRTSADLVVSLTLDAEASFVRISVRGDNRRENHRIRLVLRGDVTGGAVWADAAFGPVRREPIVVEDPAPTDELPPPTAPLHRYVSRFTDRGGLTVFSDGLAEYEARDDGILMTLVRGVGELSRNDIRERPGHAGWPAPTPRAQCLGEFAGAFAVLLHGPRTPATLDLIERTADDVLNPLVGTTLRSSIATAPRVEGVELIGECLTFCALKESEDGQYLVLRCVNVGDATVAGRWRLPFDVHDTKLARLDETILTDLPSEGREVRFDAPPRAVVTLLVR